MRWDDQWFYVESDGIADHEMMTGITNWQQQIPVPQYYYGTNATVGVDNKPSYTNFDDQFAGAGAFFIWLSNLVLDNEVIARFTSEE